MRQDTQSRRYQSANQRAAIRLSLVCPFSRRCSLACVSLGCITMLLQITTATFCASRLDKSQG
jgi:hypothetical protein